MFCFYSGIILLFVNTHMSLSAGRNIHLFLPVFHGEIMVKQKEEFKMKFREPHRINWNHNFKIIMDFI
jgi:hypothetical protein